MSVLFFFFVRLASVSTLAVLRLLLTYNQRDYLFLSVLLTHFFLAYFYSRKQILARVLDRRSAPRLYGLAAVALGFSFVGWPDMGSYFGVHHTLSDGYLVHRSTRERLAGKSRALLLARLLLNAYVYVMILVCSRWPSAGHYCLAGLAAACTPFFWALIRSIATLGPQAALEYLGFEGIGIGVALLSLRYPIDSQELIFYHLLFWLIWPLPGFYKQQSLKPLKYLLANAVMISVFYLFSPAVGIPFAVPGDMLHKQGAFWGYLHITSSFALSVLNPGVLRRFFSPAAAVAMVEA